MKTILQKLSLILIIGLIFNVNILAQSYSGAGTVADPYQISSSGDDNPIGGFVDHNSPYSTIEECYGLDNVSTIHTGNLGIVGGFVGGNDASSGSGYNANFFGRNISNQTTVTGATAKDYLDDSQTFISVSLLHMSWEMVTCINNSFSFLRLKYSSPTNGVRAITANSATCGGNVFDNSSNDVTECGICWSTSSSPTTADSKTSDETATGTFTSSLTGLSASTTYYVRAYVTNNVGTSYGDEETFTIDSAMPVKLTTFTGIAGNAGVILNWNTATEVSNYGFQVEKKKENGKSNWDAISFV